MKNLIVDGRIREIATIDEQKLRVNKDIKEELEKKVETIIKDACRRALSNKRTTILKHDL